MRTWLQSQSSSSATIIGSDVLMPCPISGFFDTMVTDKLYDRSLPFRKAYDLRFIRNVHIK